MTREELIAYIDNSIMMGDIVTEKSEIYQRLNKLIYYYGEEELLGAVCVDGVMYIKKDDYNYIHLVYYDVRQGRYEKLDLADCIDIIDEDAFSRDVRLKSISGESVIKIGNSAFYDTHIENINFPNVEEIGTSCFYAANIKSATLNKLKKVSAEAFKLSKIRNFRGDEVEVVEDDAFYGCLDLRFLRVSNARIIHTNGLNLSQIKIFGSKFCRFVD